MAISAGAMVRTLGSWLAGAQMKDAVVDSKPVQAKDAGVSSFGWGALDEEETQRVRKAGVDLMKFQSVNRGY
jgi:hypothetical protein